MIATVHIDDDLYITLVNGVTRTLIPNPTSKRVNIPANGIGFSFSINNVEGVVEVIPVLDRIMWAPRQVLDSNEEREHNEPPE